MHFMNNSRRQFLSGSFAFGAASALTATGGFSAPAHARTGLYLPQAGITAHFVIEPQSGTVLSQNNADEPIHPASITKLFLAAAYYDLKNNGLITPTNRMESDLRKALIVSDNRAAARLGEDISLAPSMQERAAEADVMAGTQWAFSETIMKPFFTRLNLDNTQIWNTSGLPGRRYTGTPQNVSTAHDIVRLSAHTLGQNPEILEITSSPYVDEARRSRPNTNRLLPNSPRPDAIPTNGVDGLKTGYIDASRFNLAFTAARDGKRIIGVTIGNPTNHARFAHAAELVEDGFARLAEIENERRMAQIDHIRRMQEAHPAPLSPELSGHPATLTRDL